MAARKSKANQDTPKKTKKGTIHPDGKTYFKGECILREKVEGGRPLYLVKYKGYSTAHAQWEPWENVGSDLLDDWENEKEVVEMNEYWEGEEHSDDEEDSRDEEVEGAADHSESEDDEDSRADDAPEEEKNAESDIEMDDDTSSLSSELSSSEELHADAEGDVEMGGADAFSDENQADVDLDGDQISPGDVDVGEAGGEGEEEKTESQEGWENVPRNDHVEEANGADVDMMRDEMEDEPLVAEGGSNHLKDRSGDDLTSAKDVGEDAFSESATAGIDRKPYDHSAHAIDELPGMNSVDEMDESFGVPPDPGPVSPDFLREPGPVPTLTQILAHDIGVARQGHADSMGVVTSIKGIDEWLPKNVLG